MVIYVLTSQKVVPTIKLDLSKVLHACIAYCFVLRKLGENTGYFMMTDLGWRKMVGSGDLVNDYDRRTVRYLC